MTTCAHYDKHAGTCGAAGARLFLPGWRCPAHTPAALAGLPEPGQGRYRPPNACWCGTCPPKQSLKGVTAHAVTLTPGRACGALDAALSYAAQGWPVFWLGRSKRPVANCAPCKTADHDPAECGHLTCHGFYAATLDPRRIAAMRRAVPGGLLAIRTGHASGLAVIDIDPRNGGRIDPALMTPTAAVATGGGGWHLYYRHPGTPLLAALPGHPGIDIKADGGYTVAPPSVHPGTGRPYQWAAARAVTEMPPALRAALTPPPLPSPPRSSPAALSAPPRAPGAGGISDPAALLAAHLRAIADAPEGHRRHTVYGAARGAWRIIATGAITEADGRAALTAAGLAAGQTPRDIAAAIDGGFTAEQAAPASRGVAA